MSLLFLRSTHLPFRDSLLTIFPPLHHHALPRSLKVISTGRRCPPLLATTSADPFVTTRSRLFHLCINAPYQDFSRSFVEDGRRPPLLATTPAGPFVTSLSRFFRLCIRYLFLTTILHYLFLFFTPHISRFHLLFFLPFWCDLRISLSGATLFEIILTKAFSLAPFHVHPDWVPSSLIGPASSHSALSLRHGSLRSPLPRGI